MFIQLSWRDGHKPLISLNNLLFLATDNLAIPDIDYIVDIVLNDVCHNNSYSSIATSELFRKISASIFLR